jgi:hypothetical protein
VDEEFENAASGLFFEHQQCLVRLKRHRSHPTVYCASSASIESPKLLEDGGVITRIPATSIIAFIRA